ncbi:MAG TPA: arylsulfatase [Opitutales bacterium]|nr:arylsulfatase [Opitutales bacterium]
MIRPVAGIGLIVVLALGAFLHAAPERPNIIAILVDDMGYSDLGVMGSEIRTPHLDALAENGVLMTHLYTTARCSPSRASLMTGDYPHAVGMGHLDTTQTRFEGYRGRIPFTVPLLPERLQAVGYRTLAVGKWHLGSEPEHWPINRGFERFYGIPAGGGVYFWPPVGLDRPVYLNHNQVDPAEEPDWYSTDAFTDYAITFIEEAVDDEAPFFLYAAYIAPHFPLQAFPEDIARYEGVYTEGHEAIRQARYERQIQLGVLPGNHRLSPDAFPKWASVQDQAKEARKMQVYAAMVDRLDQNIGRLVASLEAQGIAENTVIFFLSDNGGEAAGLNRTPSVEIGRPDSFAAYGRNWANVSNTPYRKYKKFTHEGGTLTPLIAYWPAGLDTPGRITHEPAHIMDLYRTILDMAGLPDSESHCDKPATARPSRSLLPLLRGEAADPDRPIFLEHEGHQAVRAGDWKLVRSNKSPWELYNLRDDPSELNDLASQHSERVQQMKQAYQNWMKANHVRSWP